MSSMTAATLASTELDQVCRYLEMTRDYAVGATQGLSGAQWTFRPAPGRWTIAEIAEHMVTVQELVLGPIKAGLAAAPESTADDSQQVDAIVWRYFPDRLNKFQAPEAAQPTGTWAAGVALSRLAENCARLMEQVRSTLDLRLHRIEAPPLKAASQGAHELMDGYQWVLAVAAHTERHSKQILEVRADPNFPGS